MMPYFSSVFKVLDKLDFFLWLIFSISLSLRQLVLINALINYNLGDDLVSFHPFNIPQSEKLSPTEDLSLKILTELRQNYLIAIHPDSADAAVDINENAQISYYSD